MNSIPEPTIDESNAEYREMVRNQVSTKRASVSRVRLLVVGAGMILCGCKTAVTVLSAMAAIRSERGSDDEVRRMCDNGIGQASPKMRAMCLQIAADEASPVFATAILRATRMLAEEMHTALMYPLQSGTFQLVFGVVCLLPWAVPVLRLLGVVQVGTSSASCAVNNGACPSQNHVIVLKGAPTFGGTGSQAYQRRRITELPFDP